MSFNSLKQPSSSFSNAAVEINKLFHALKPIFSLKRKIRYSAIEKALETKYKYPKKIL